MKTKDMVSFITKHILSIIILASIVISIPFCVYGYNLHNYNKYMSLGQSSLSKENFDEAIANYNNALKYENKYEKYISEEIKSAQILKKSKETYVMATSLMNQKKYLDAINTFKNVPIEDAKYFSKANDKINECRTSYISENISKAKAQAGNEKYDSAIQYLDTILKFDSSYKEAIVLKDQYNKEIQKAKEEDTAEKQTTSTSNKLTANSTIASKGTNTQLPNLLQSQKLATDPTGLFTLIKRTVVSADNRLLVTMIIGPNDSKGSKVTGVRQDMNQVVFYSGNMDEGGVYMAPVDYSNTPQGYDIKIHFTIEYKGKNYSLSYHFKA